MKKTKYVKRTEAEERQNYYNGLSTKEKIKLAESRTGKSRKEIMKLKRKRHKEIKRDGKL